jgi:hypothetical protein
MKSAEVSRQLQRLRAAITQALASTAHLELQAHWARYFCVLTAGFLENAIKEILGDFIRRTCHNQVRRYAATELGRLRNPNGEKFLQLMHGFDTSWAADLEVFMSDGGRKDALDAIMNHRHLIAHGKDSQITIVALRDYISKAAAVLERLEHHVNP